LLGYIFLEIPLNFDAELVMNLLQDTMVTITNIYEYGLKMSINSLKIVEEWQIYEDIPYLCGRWGCPEEYKNYPCLFS